MPFLLVLSFLQFNVPTKANAEYIQAGFGYQNWGGWDFNPSFWGEGATVQGSILRGMGYYLEGAGQYNLLTAEADAINTQTWIELNEYLYQSQLEAARRYQAINSKREAKLKSQAQKRYLQLRDNPTSLDIQDGNAINLKVALLTQPQYAEKVYTALNVPMPAAVVDSIALNAGSYALTVSLSELRKGASYPLALGAPNYLNNRTAIDKALVAIGDKNFQNASNRELAANLNAEMATLKAQLINEQAFSGDNYLFVTRMERLSKALSKGNFGESLTAIAAVNPASLGNLLREMNAQGVRFGSAETPEQLAANQKIFAVLKAAPTVLDKETLKALADTMANYKN